jgi:hypothetical protein
MLSIRHFLRYTRQIRVLFFFILSFNWGNAQIDIEKRSKLIKPEVEITNDIYWYVKAYRPDAKLLDVKAIDVEGNLYDVRAIQSSDDTSILNVKALVDGKHLPIKLILKNNERYFPVKAIDDKGALVNIKVVGDNREILDIKGVSKSGNIIHLRAITRDSVFYNIIAISPEGKVNAVKGIKMLDTPVEAVINGVSIFAHVKAIDQH